MLASGALNGSDPVTRGPHHLNAVDETDEHRQSITHHSLIVGDEHADRRFVHAGTTTSTRHPCSIGPA